ncbi:helix-turn-helix domain-containing protein [Dyadobacter sp. CY107]|uniref:helix-turn-helix domain-containing protein n=1 Tax=Dyadobacter fanqingshengii TaxID=2906443 RepID=UPI001F3A7643|nr:helix-turn-helix domain-containing protein [Dyadobacter fanqingshengii]MCF2502587.1 helix-turn-helix domain-containing protein [Dyadobacter fanqingshengii]
MGHIRGLSFNFDDDQQLLDQGIIIYDALYSWAKHLQSVKHTQSPTEQLLLAVLHAYMNPDNKRKPPVWVKELNSMIQDQIDMNLALSLTELAESVDVNPAYVSRTFARYFDDLSFGEYIRKLRIDKAIQLLEATDYTLTEIALPDRLFGPKQFYPYFQKTDRPNSLGIQKNRQKVKYVPVNKNHSI